MDEVWANMLHIVYAALVAACGWSSRALTDPTTMEGNGISFHLLFDTLNIQGTVRKTSALHISDNLESSIWVRHDRKPLKEIILGIVLRFQAL